MELIIRSEEELNALIDRRLEERRKGTCMVKTVMDEFEREYELFNSDENRKSWEEWERLRAIGWRSNVAWKVRNAISALIRAHFKVKNAAQISADREDEVRAFIKQILETAA